MDSFENEKVSATSVYRKVLRFLLPDQQSCSFIDEKKLKILH
jgi:hypothetical protein